MEILLSSMFHISWLKYVLIASSTRTDFKHRYDENNLIVVNSWTCYFNKSSFMDKTFYPYQFIVPLQSVRLQVFRRVYQDLNLESFMETISDYIGI